MRVTKAIITASGRGTRFLPVSSAYQKEMVPVMHKPQLQWVIEEALESGISDIAIVAREGVEVLRRYLEIDNALLDFLKNIGKSHLMDSVVQLKEKAKITFIEQKESDPYGNGTPFILAKEFTDGQPVIGMWGDDIIIRTDPAKSTVIEQMLNYYDEFKPAAVMSVQKVPRSEIHKFGSYDYYDENESSIPYHAKLLMEKPDPDKAPSFMANSCRFVLGPNVFEELSKKIKGKDGEIWLTDAVARLIEAKKTVIAPPWSGSLVASTGDPMGWLKSNILFAINDDRYRDELRSFVKNIEFDV
ncbi:MAG: sugar phosphate nucleotidyltransferase [Desulfobacterales bacterium]|jgi:UTP--glucose-1-phosphate uridylyltransferase